jgi:phage regulator Rha-like protein
MYIEGGVLGFQESNYLNKQNKSQPMFTMDRRAFMILSMGFTGDRALEFKQNFMDAFEAMEEAMKKRESPFEIPQTLSEALMLAAKQAEQLELVAPKVQAFDTYLDTKATMTFTEAAKSLGMRSAQQLTRRLREDGIIFKDGYSKNLKNMPRMGYEAYLESKRVFPKDSPLNSYPQTRVTPAGLEWLRQKYVLEA